MKPLRGYQSYPAFGVTLIVVVYKGLLWESWQEISISFMNFNVIWGNFDRHGLWTFTTHEDAVRPWASILMPAGSLDVISNKFYPRLRNGIGYRAECWKHWNLTRVFILRPSEKHVGIIRQQCLLIFVKKITWIFNFFLS